MHFAKAIVLRSAVLGLAVLLGSAGVAFGADEVLGTHFKSCKDDPEVARRVAQYQAAGEAVTIADIRTPEMPDQENAVVELRKAASLLRVHGKEVSAWLRYDMGDRGLPMTSKERSFAHQASRENANVVPLFDEAMGKKGFCWPTQMSSPLIDVQLSDLSPQRDLANFLDMDAVLQHDQGDDASVLSDISRLLFLERALDHHPPVYIVALVAGGTRKVACDTMRKIASTLNIGKGPNAASPTELAELIHQLLDESELTQSYRTSLFGERVMYMDTADAITNDRMDISKLGAPNQPVAPPGFTPSQMSGLLKSSIQFDLPIALDNATAAGEAVTCSDWTSAQKKLSTAHDELDKDVTKHLFAGIMMPSFRRGVLICFRTKASSRSAAVALAVRWYQEEHGDALPPTLEALVPKYLPAVPADPFGVNNAPLRYVAADPDPKVYALCPDGTDNGGQDHDANGKWLSSEHMSPTIFHFRQQPRDLSDLPADLKD